MTYTDFLAAKAQVAHAGGFTPTVMPDHLFPYQQHLVEWAVHQGRGAIFADCGLGKTPMELAWAENIYRRTGRPVLLLTPLAVSFQIVAEADGGTLLDITQTLQATTGAHFKQQAILATGQRGFQWEETVEAKAGQKGDLKVPGELVLVLRPFLGSDPIAVKARLRFRVTSTGLQIGVKLNEPRRVLEDAFAQVVLQVQKSSPVFVTYGRP